MILFMTVTTGTSSLGLEPGCRNAVCGYSEFTRLTSCTWDVFEACYEILIIRTFLRCTVNAVWANSMCSIIRRVAKLDTSPLLPATTNIHARVLAWLSGLAEEVELNTLGVRSYFDSCGFVTSFRKADRLRQSFIKFYNM